KYCWRHQSGMPSPTLSSQTVVVALAVLLLGAGSDTPELTVAVLVMLVISMVADGEPAIVMVATPLLVMSPRLQTTTPPILVHVPVLAIADTTETLAGTGSVTITLVAVDGPTLETVNVYVSDWLVSTGLGDADFVIATS